MKKLFLLYFLKIVFIIFGFAERDILMEEK
jgi:hypothetical protein